MPVGSKWQQILIALSLFLLPVSPAVTADITAEHTTPASKHTVPPPSPQKPLADYFTESWSKVHGLPHNTVNAIAQTADGYIWFATWEGVARYNGREFIVFDRSPETGLPDSGIRALHHDSEGHLWVGGSRGGLARVTAQQWHAKQSIGTLINRLLADSQQQLWIGTEGGGLYRLGPDQQRRHWSQADGLPFDAVYSLLEDEAGRIWVGTGAGLVYVLQDKLVPLNFPEINQARIFALAERDNGQLLIGTERGLFQYDPDTQHLTEFLTEVPVTAILLQQDLIWIGTVDRGLLRYSDGQWDQLGQAEGLPNNRVLDLLLDRENSLWVGTNGGVFRLRDAPFTTYQTQHGLADNFVRTVLSHADGCLYVGSSRGLNQRCDKEWRRLDLSEVSIGQSVLSLAQGLNNTLWVGTYSDGAMQLQLTPELKVLRHYRVGQGLAANEIRAMLPLSDGALWLATAQGATLMDARGVAQKTLTTEHGLPSIFSMALHKTAESSLFFGTGEGVAFTLGEHLQTLPLNQLDDAEYAFGFLEDKDAGLLWLPTDRGLVALDLHSGDLTIIGRQQGIPFDKLFQLVQDQHGYFWLSTNRGVLRFSRQQALEVVRGQRQQVEFELYGESDGMASAQANGGSNPAAALHHDGTVWIATSRGVSVVNPDHLSSILAMQPPVVMEALLVNGQLQVPQQHYQLAAGVNRLELRYVGLGYVMPHRIQYRTKLEGFDLDWVKRGNQVYAEYTNLGPGDYLFRVAARYPDGQWSELDTAIQISIAPFIWQRLGFQLFLLLVLASILFLAVRWRLAALQRSELKLKQLVAEQTAELQQLARQDVLTGMANRRAFDEALQLEFNRAQRSGSTLCLALLDIDHFKRVNDQWSHTIGDEVLKRVALQFKLHSRNIDHLARWGGEEFVMLMPNTDLTAASEVCERLRLIIQHTDCEDIAQGLQLTISIGLAANVGMQDSEQLLQQADKALYQAKHTGRNRLVVID
ncbi:diguanylate cyclase [Arsukibacterium sp.]|uniref:diguanylate cyclase n=1 Tax=Arsukibacterium sp. TaxID=1977258 RepID=UPI002FD96A1E